MTRQFNQDLTQRMQTMFEDIYDVFVYYDGPLSFHIVDTHDAHWYVDWMNRDGDVDTYALAPVPGLNPEYRDKEYTRRLVEVTLGKIEAFDLA